MSRDLNCFLYSQFCYLIYCKQWEFYFLLSNSYLFISFPFFVCYINRRGDSEHPVSWSWIWISPRPPSLRYSDNSCLGLDFKGTLPQFPWLQNDDCCNCSVDYRVKEFLSTLNLLRIFHVWVLTIIKCCIHWDDLVFFSFNLIL